MSERLGASRRFFASNCDIQTPVASAKTAQFKNHSLGDHADFLISDDIVVPHS